MKIGGSLLVELKDQLDRLDRWVFKVRKAYRAIKAFRDLQDHKVSFPNHRPAERSTDGKTTRVLERGNSLLLLLHLLFPLHQREVYLQQTFKQHLTNWILRKLLKLVVLLR